jgi:hypothetical protein
MVGHDRKVGFLEEAFDLYHMRMWAGIRTQAFMSIFMKPEVSEVECGYMCLKFT